MASESNQSSEVSHEAGPSGLSEQEKAKARKWFGQAKVVGETRNYDYAIECYITGLGIWPDAIQEGHMPLRAISMARKQAKGKPAGLRQSLKRKTTTKNPLQNMLNAEFLLSMDPGNLAHMEQMFINAGKAELHSVTNWIGDIYFEALRSEKKVGAQRLLKVRSVFEELGDALEDEGDPAGAVQAFEKALRALNILSNMNPDKMDYFNEMNNLSGKLTIAKGKYNVTGASFKESLRDREAQAELHDRDRLVQDEDRVQQLIVNARKDYEANPDMASKLTVLVDLLVKQEKPEDEREAIKLLTENYGQTKNYRFKMRADDIRMAQYRRHARVLQQKLKADPNKELLAQAQMLRDEAMEFELTCGKERVENYPTDLRVRLKYAQTLFVAGKFDEAIPEFQAARADPRSRAACNLFIGRCFHEKGRYGPAVDVLKDLIKTHEGAGDDEVTKETYYWLGRSYEAAGKIEEATTAYNQIIQWDYNFRDVRKRIDDLREKDEA
jgi:tetratricopeptide (TPR) repeat protein